MNNKLVIEERQRDIGNFLVGRLLPFRKKRQVGPFTFIDHMGPTELKNNTYMDVDQHPHIGLSTLSYLLSGEIEHKDSIGTVQTIKPGDVAFMTSGKGVTHTERTPKNKRNGGTILMHGYQIWVALPKDLEEIEPTFSFYEADSLPQKNTEEYDLKLLAGKGFGLEAPLQGYSPMFMVDIKAKKDTCLNLKDKLAGELAIVVVNGKVTDEDEEITAGEMLISKSNEQCSIGLEKDSRILIFGGEPLEQEVHLLWNFASASLDKLEEAKQNWIAKKFPKIVSDDTYIPFPEQKIEKYKKKKGI